MRIVLFEWVTGGGLVEERGALPASLLAEGSAMISSVAADFARLPGARVSVLRDARLPELALPNCETVDVHSSRDRNDELERLASQADYTLVVAPEFDSILLQAVRQVRGLGSASLNSSDEFIELASDKHRTSAWLKSRGISTPEARIVDADAEKLPVDFSYPAVLKPIDGAGSQHLLRVEGPKDEPPPYPWPRRLEQFCPGHAVSVAALCGTSGFTTLPPCWQRLSADGRFVYLGGGIIRQSDIATRATNLTQRALQALPAAHGFVGLDLVLGPADDGTRDVVIEVNPRLTTSYVGLRAALDGNLAEAMIAAARGESFDLSFHEAPVEFDADGRVRTGVG